MPRYTHMYGIKTIKGKKRYLWTSQRGLFYKVHTKNGHTRRYWVELNPEYDPRRKGGLPYSPPSTSEFYIE